MALRYTDFRRGILYENIFSLAQTCNAQETINFFELRIKITFYIRRGADVISS